MKQILLLTAAVLIVSTSCFAKIWRVNNNPGVSANFTSLQAAHDGAASGDTLYLESSPYTYGYLTSSKKLAVIGTGYFLDQNLNLQASALQARVDGMSLNAGSAGSSVEGLSFNGNALYIYSNDVVVRRNHFSSFNGAIPDWGVGIIYIYNGASNIFITQNFAVIISNNAASSGILISNNYISSYAYAGDNTTGGCLQLNANTVAIIKNNIFRRGAVTVYNSNISNNIMHNGTLGGTGNLVSNNIGNATQFGTADGNQQNVDMTTVFVGTGSNDGYYKLKVGSPAIGAGYGSTAQNPVDAGMFGGSTSYVLSGLPAIPSIYFFANQPVGSNSDPIDVQIKVKSNN
jgi:hypothetical protein